MAEQTVRTRQGDTIDAVCWRYYGATKGHVEAVFAANPGLSELPPILPSGTLLTMPEAVAAATPSKTITNLWD